MMVSSLSISGANVIEGDGAGTVTLNFTVTLSPADNTQTVTVDFRTSTTAENVATFGSNAAATASPDAGADYVSQMGTLTFNPGDTSKPISIAVNSDCVPEPTQYLRVFLSNGVNATISTAIGQGEITTDDQRFLDINDVSVTEGDGAGTTTLNFTVSLSGSPVTAGSVAACGPVTVDFRTSTTAENVATFGSNAAATASPDAGADYVSQMGTLTFNPGDTSKPISVVVNSDCAPEPTQYLRVFLSNAVNASINTAIGQGQITTDDQRFLDINNVSVTEGDGAGTTTLSFTVSLFGSPVTAGSVAACGPVTVDFRTSTTAENVATFGSNAAATASPDAGADYVSQMGTLTFNPGDTSKPISVAVNSDCVPEPDQFLRVFLSNAVNATINNGTGTGLITTDDQRFLDINDVSVTEGDGAGTTTLNFTVSLSGSPVTAGSVTACGPVTVDFRTSTTAENVATFGSNAAATASPDAGADYVSQMGTLTFNAGDTSKPISIAVNSDCVAEPTQYLRVFLSNAANATISRGIGQGEITTDDQRFLDINGVSVTEGDGAGTTTLSFTVSLFGSPVTAGSVAACGPVTVDFRTSTTAENVATFGSIAAATASPDAGADYVTQMGTLTFNAGDTSKPISVVVNSDCVPEPDQFLRVFLSNAVNATISTAIGQGQITTDDQRFLDINDVSVTEGDGAGTTTLSFTVSLSGSPVTAGSVAACGPVTVDFRTSTTAENVATFGSIAAATASPDAGADYVSQMGTLTFNAGDTSKPISITVNSDCVAEPTQFLRVFLSNTVNATINNGTSTGQITTDDGRSLSINAVIVTEGAGVAVNLNFTVTLAGSPVTAGSVAACGPVTVDFRTSTTAENVATFGSGSAATASPDAGAD